MNCAIAYTLLKIFIRLVDVVRLVGLGDRRVERIADEMPRDFSRQVKLPSPKYLHLRLQTKNASNDALRRQAIEVASVSVGTKSESQYCGGTGSR